MEYTTDYWRRADRTMGGVWRHIAIVVKDHIAITYINGEAKYYYVN